MYEDEIIMSKFIQTELTEEQFISGLREDLPMLSGENFKRHKPAYWDEVNYYNAVIEACPKELMLSSLLCNFMYNYIEKNAELYDLVENLLIKYDSGDFDLYNE